MANVWANSLARHPRATCHIAGCNNSIRHIENRFSPYFVSFCLFNAVWALTSGGFRIVSHTLLHWWHVSTNRKKEILQALSSLFSINFSEIFNSNKKLKLFKCWSTSFQAPNSCTEKFSSMLLCLCLLTSTRWCRRWCSPRGQIFMALALTAALTIMFAYDNTVV